VHDVRNWAIESPAKGINATDELKKKKAGLEA
jgi:hypothetical protein